MSQILNYLPSAGDMYSDFQADKPKKKFSIPNPDPLKAKNPFLNPKESPGPHMHVSAMNTPSKTTPKYSDLTGANKNSKNSNLTTINGKQYISSVPIKYSTSLYRKIDISNIDYILVTHLDKSQGLALPTLINDLDFRGQILMTLPLKQIGTEIKKEFIKMNHKRVEKGILGEVWKS